MTGRGDGDDYAVLAATLVRVTAKAALWHHPLLDEPVWIARSLLHGADDAMLDHLARGTEHTVRVRRWKLDEEGLG